MLLYSKRKKKTIESQCMSITFQTHSGNHWIMGSAIQIHALKRNLLQLFSSDYLAKYHYNNTLNKQRKFSITKIEEVRQKISEEHFSNIRLLNFKYRTN